MESQAIRDIAAERERQMAVEGWMPAHDDTHTGAELAAGAMAYLDYNVRRTVCRSHETHSTSMRRAAGFWPWRDDLYFKPTEDLRRNLVKAAALLAAEIERLDRAAGRTITLVPPAEDRHV